MKNVNIYYPIEVWILSILGGPIILPLHGVFEIKFNADISEAIGGYFVLVPIAFIYSIPTLLISYVSYRLLLKSQVNVLAIKGILIVLGFTLFALTLDLIGIPVDPTRDIEDMMIHLSYSFFFLLGSILFKIEKKTETIIS